MERDQLNEENMIHEIGPEDRTCRRCNIRLSNNIILKRHYRVRHPGDTLRVIQQPLIQCNFVGYT